MTMTLDHTAHTAEIKAKLAKLEEQAVWIPAERGWVINCIRQLQGSVEILARQFAQATRAYDVLREASKGKSPDVVALVDRLRENDKGIAALKALAEELKERLFSREADAVGGRTDEKHRLSYDELVSIKDQVARKGWLANKEAKLALSGIAWLIDNVISQRLQLKIAYRRIGQSDMEKLKEREDLTAEVMKLKKAIVDVLEGITNCGSLKPEKLKGPTTLYEHQLAMLMKAVAPRYDRYYTVLDEQMARTEEPGLLAGGTAPHG